MADSGVNIVLLLAQLINLLLFISWIVLVVLSLRQLARMNLPMPARLGWAAIILLIPVFGAVVFTWLHREKRAPRENNQ